MAKISVIVPVYKVEPYLHCCIDSILAQTFRDFELILVDDGSPDNCGTICDEYAEKDDRIVVIHQENGGLSAARNTGIDWVFANSDSEWITFVDSDDYIPSEYLERLQSKVTDNVDIVSTFGEYFEKQEEIKDISCVVHEVYTMTGREACLSLFLVDGRITVPAWGKLFRRELFRELRFPVGKIHEDEALIPSLLYLADTVVSLRAWMYGYRQNPMGIMLSKFSIKRFDIVDAGDQCMAFFKKNGDTELRELAEKRKKSRWSSCIVKAWQSGIYHDIPTKYKMPLLKAFCYLLVETIQSADKNMMIQRVHHMFKNYTDKK